MTFPKMNDAKKALQMNEDMDVILAKEGQSEAFRRLYEDHALRIYRLAFRYTQSPQDAEDIMQDTFIKAFKRIHTFRFDVSQNFSAWLNTICLNSTADFFRRQRRKHRHRQVSLSELTHELLSQNPAPDETAERTQAAQRIRAALDILPPKQRLVFEMRFNRHSTIKDIARDLQCSQSTVKTQLFRGLKKLRRTLEPIWGEP